MLIPKKTKYRFVHSLSYEGKSKGNSSLSKGDYGLKILNGCYISNRSIESARKVMSRVRKGNKDSKIWINIFPHLGKTKKPLEVRMGSGKGSIDSWVAVVKSGTIAFEIKGLPHKIALDVLRKVSCKLPSKCKIVSKYEF